MPKTSIGAQMYTLRDFTKTPAGIAKTMKKVKQIGYDAVQLSALGPIDKTELKKILDGEELEVAATHIGFEKMRDEARAVIDEHQLLGCKHTAIGGIPQQYRSGEGFLTFAKEASKVIQNLKQAGLTFSYHNHSFELERFGTRTGLQILLEESDPSLFNFEIDTYWIQHGGGDPADWIKKVHGRCPLVHFKDMAILDGKPVMSEVGEGNLNWSEILRACRDSGVRWYLVEQDVCQRDPFESLAMSLRNMKAMGLR